MYVQKKYLKGGGKVMMKSKIIVISLMMIVISSIFVFGTISVSAEEMEAVHDTRGLFANITCNVHGDGSGNVIAEAKNEFTLGTSTIITYVYLYRSEVYVDSIEDMELVGYAYSPDLNIFQSINVSESTSGRQSYWAAKLRYKFDTKDWVETNTPIILFDKYGNAI